LFEHCPKVKAYRNHPKIIFWTIIFFIAYTIIGFFIPPPIIKIIAVNKIEENLSPLYNPLLMTLLETSLIFTSPAESYQLTEIFQLLFQVLKNPLQALKEIQTLTTSYYQTANNMQIV
jgi:hypothetical protein